jgi:hypothetical protein
MNHRYVATSDVARLMHRTARSISCRRTTRPRIARQLGGSDVIHSSANDRR